MGSWCLPLLSGLSILLILLGSEVGNSEDINECQTGEAKCKQRAYCRNTQGDYYCSCVPYSDFFNWLGGIFKLDYPECYESFVGRIQLSQIVWDELRNNGNKKEVALKETKDLQTIEMLIWNTTVASPGKGESIPLDLVYETKECKKAQEKTLLEAGNNTIRINCSNVFQGVARERFDGETKPSQKVWLRNKGNKKEVALKATKDLQNIEMLIRNMTVASPGKGESIPLDLERFDGETKPSQNVWGVLRNKGNKKEVALKATKDLQTIEMLIWNTTVASPGKGESIPLDLVYETKECKKAQEKTLLEAGNNTIRINCSNVFQGAARGAHAMTLITYGSLEKILDGSFFHNRKWIPEVRLNSRVVSCTVGVKEKVLSDPVLLTFRNTQPSDIRAKHLCVYWDGSKDSGSWSTEGCFHVTSNDSHTICKCLHLSSFAVLLALTPQVDRVLAVITYVGLSLSLCCLFLAALTFFLCGSIHSTATTLHLQLSVCLFLAHLLFLVGMDQTEPEVLCSVIAGVLHYLYLAAFLWMFLEGLHLFLIVRNLKVVNYTSTGQFKKRFMYLLGYGVPAVIVGVSAAVGHQNYGTYTHCWLKFDKGFIWSFMGPVAVIILINLLFYFQVLWILRSKISSLNKEVSTIQDTRVMTLKAIAQLFILGCSWGLGFFMVERVGKTTGLIFAYAFTIINVLQGFVIFVIHCLLNRQVRMEYKKWLRGMKKGSKLESTGPSGSTTHTKMEEMGKSLEVVQRSHAVLVRLQSQVHAVSALWQATKI